MLKADVRILAATNQDLDKAVKEKRFREDLYFRLKVIPIYLPPLRERRGDIALLIGYFIDKINREMGLQISGVSPEAQKLLEDHSWPGNVRELENTLIRAAVLSSGPILFPKDFTLQNKPAATRWKSTNFPWKRSFATSWRIISAGPKGSMSTIFMPGHRAHRTSADRAHAQKNQRQSDPRRANSRHQPQHAAQENHRSAHRAQKRTVLKFHAAAPHCRRSTPSSIRSRLPGAIAAKFLTIC